MLPVKWEQFFHGIRLFNWSVGSGCQRYYIKRKEGEREQDSGETERERVWEAVCCSKRKIALAINLTVRERTTCDTNVRLIRETENMVNDVVPTICIRWTVCLKATFGWTDKSQISYKYHNSFIKNNAAILQWILRTSKIVLAVEKSLDSGFAFWCVFKNHLKHIKHKNAVQKCIEKFNLFPNNGTTHLCVILT